MFKVGDKVKILTDKAGYETLPLDSTGLIVKITGDLCTVSLEDQYNVGPLTAVADANALIAELDKETK